MIGLLQSLVRRASRAMRPDSRNVLAVSLLLAGPSRQPRPITDWPERKVLVLAPHADDEAIGCGGAIARHVDAGASVAVVIVTDGALGDSRLHDRTLPAELRRSLTAEVVALRKQEARESARILGASRLDFLEAPDGALKATDEFAARLALILDRFQPDLVYLPFVMDLHEDHWQTNNLFGKAMQGAEPWKDRLLVRGYEVWAPLVANRIADVTSVSARKQQALAAYASQLKDKDYSSAVAGLNAYRGMHLPGAAGKQAEAFFESSGNGYLHLLESARLRLIDSEGRSPATAASPQLSR